MDRNTFNIKVLGRGNSFVRKLYWHFSKKMAYKISRIDAHRWRARHVMERGHSILNRKLLKEIKEYSKSRFGSVKFWPWLATYTEIRGEFKEGWIPYDYYRFNLIDELNIEVFSKLSGIKTFDYRIFGENIVESLAIRVKNQLRSLDGTIESENSLLDKLKGLNCEVVIKPDNESGGKGIQFMHTDEITRDHLKINDSAIIQKVVHQHHLLNNLNPSSINTFRVLTCMNENGKVEMKFMFLRFGIGGTRLDNISSGGAWVYIKPNGFADRCAYNLEGFEVTEMHPYTEVKFSTLSFPYYNAIIQLCRESHHHMPYSKLIGWDVFVEQDGIPKLLEWNAKNPFFWPVEAIYGPFW